MDNNNQIPFKKPIFNKGKYKLGKKNGKKFWYYIDENNKVVPADIEFIKKYNNYVKEYNEYVRNVKEYNKLVRGRIADIIEKSGKSCKVEILSEEEYLKISQ